MSILPMLLWPVARFASPVGVLRSDLSDAKGVIHHSDNYDDTRYRVWYGIVEFNVPLDTV